MEINWIIIGIVAATLLALIVYLIKQNQKTKKVTRHFNADTTEFYEEEDELNNN